MFAFNWGFNNFYRMSNPFAGGCCHGHHHYHAHHHCHHANPFGGLQFAMAMPFIMSMMSGQNYTNPFVQQLAQPLQFTMPSMPVVPQPYAYQNYYNNTGYYNQQPIVDYGSIFKNNYNNVLTSYSGSLFDNSSYSAGGTQQFNYNNIFNNTQIVDTGKLDKNFLNRVKQMAQNLNCDYKDLLAIINSESSFNPKAGYDEKTGKCGGYVGLIQFGDMAIQELNNKYGLNLTKEKIVNMSAIEQLDLAEKLWRNNKNAKFGSNARLNGPDLYALIFLPGRADREVLCTKGERDKNGKLLGYYEGNPIDYNNDQKITKGDLQTRINQKRVDESIFA